MGLLSLLLFAVTTVLIWRNMRARAGGDLTFSRTPYLTSWVAAIFFMSVFLARRLLVETGLDLSFYNSLLISAFLVSFLLLVASAFKPVEHLGLIILPVAIICLALNLLFSRPSIPVPFDTGIQTHIISSIIAFSILCLAAVQALLLLVQERHLKQHTAAGILRALPSMHENEVTLFQTIGLGVLILTVALVSGFIYIDDIFAQHLVHKTTLSVVAWVVFAVLLWGRIYFGWRGTTAIRWTLGGFTFLILAYLGSKFVLELVLYRV